eukprot:96929-Hanusia_phi.AAC.7
MAEPLRSLAPPAMVPQDIPLSDSRKTPTILLPFQCHLMCRTVPGSASGLRPSEAAGRVHSASHLAPLLLSPNYLPLIR